MDDSVARNEYAEFVRRIREGDEHAAEELVRRYEPEIRLEVRGWLRLRNPALRRVFDSMDICQSVLASFFTRAAFGEFDLDEPSQVIRLLVGMARKKVAEQARYHQRQRRDVRRVGDGDVEYGMEATTDETPSRLASGRELLQKFRERSSTKSAGSPICGQRDLTGRLWPRSSGGHPRVAASNSLARSPGSSWNWAPTCSSGDPGDPHRGRTRIHRTQPAAAPVLGDFP